MSTFDHGDFLQDNSAENSGQTQLQLVRCPICYEDLRDESMYNIEQHLAEHDPEAKTYEFRKEVERRGERLVVDSANLLPNTNTAVEVDCRVADNEKYYTTRQHGKTYFTPVSVIEAGDRR